MQGTRFDVPGQAEDAEGGDSVPVGIELVPSEAVTRGLRMGVMVVVPALAEGKESYPHTVAGGVAGGEPA